MASPGPGTWSSKLTLDSQSRIFLLSHLTHPNGPLQCIAERREKNETANRHFTNFLRYFQGQIFEVHPLLLKFQAGPRSGGSLGSIYSLLGILEGLVIVDITTSYSQGPYPRLRALQDQFSSAGTEIESHTAFARSIDFGDKDAQDALLGACSTCSNELDQDATLDNDIAATQRPRRSQRADPNYEVWRLNSQLLDIFCTTTSHCTQCRCPTTTLALRTHRKAGKNLEIEAILLLNDPTFCGQELNFEVSSRTDSKCKPTRSKVAFADSSHTSAPVKRRPKRLKVSHICEPLKKPQASQVRLHLFVEEQSIWLENKSQPTTYSAEELRSTISLANLSSENSTNVTDRTKLVIAVILGHTLLHMYGTPWLHDWNLDKILFIRTNGTVPLKPFLLAEHHRAEGNGEDDFFQVHRHPNLLNFGVMLLELELHQSIDDYVKAEGERYANSAFLTAQEAFRKKFPEIYKNYRTAIGNCLDPNFASDVDSEADPDEFRRRIYLDIVRPLEDELEAGFGDMIDIDDLDSAVNNLDVVRLGQPIDRGLAYMGNSHLLDPKPPMQEKAHSHDQRSGAVISELLAIPTPLSSPTLRSPSPIRDMWKTRSGGSHSSPSTSLPQDEFQLFDDHGSGRDSNWERKQELSNKWMRLLQPVQKLVEKNGPLSKKVRIAIVDSGIDLNHQDMRACSENIEDVRSWVDGQTAVKDLKGGDQCGHGTHVAGLVLGIAPDAEVFIARVTNSTSMKETDHIAAAIEYAANVWRVDIINLSLGFSKRVPAILSAIKRTDCLIFAAASNGGGNYDRTWPAKLEKVICIHSADGDGNPSGFNPTAIEEDCDNFCILGEEVESAWPGQSQDGTVNLKRKTGTSFATPIAASVAALVLHFAEGTFEDKGALDELRTSSGMRKVLRLMSGQDKRLGYRYITPWNLFDIDSISSIASYIQRKLR